MPLPVPNPNPSSAAAMRHPPAFSNFCPDILDHLPKCLRTSTCNCTIPNAAKADTFWNSLDNDQDGLATLADLNAIRETFATPLAPPLSTDKNPVGSAALAESFDSLNQIFATAQADRSGTQKVGLNQQQFMELNVQRVFPSTYTFPGGCFVDPNEKINQNDFSTPAAMRASGWAISRADRPIPDSCKDAQNGLSQLTGSVFYGASAKAIVKGSGVGYVDFGNCAGSGITVLRVGGVEILRAYQNMVSQVSSFHYTNGQVVEIKAEHGAVARLNFVGFNGTLVSKAGEPCPPLPRQ